MKRLMPMVASAGLCAALLFMGSSDAAPSRQTAAVHWPAVTSRLPHDAALEARLDRILASMSTEEKVGQVIQVDISAITPDELRKYKPGSILAGGNSAPGGN